MNKRILDSDVQAYINSHLTADVHQIALAKSPFPDVSGTELAGQIAAKHKCSKKLPSWYRKEGIYYPPLLSVEQCSSEPTAQYKASLALKGPLIDLTGGFGVDCHYFAGVAPCVTHCEINEELSAIAAHNAWVFGHENTNYLATDGLVYLSSTDQTFDTIYIDPARRSSSGKVFMLKDCVPDVVGNLDLMRSRAKRIIIKTAPLLDISAGIKELSAITEIHIVSVKNEVKELLFVLDNTPDPGRGLQITAVTLNDTIKQFSFYRDEAAEPGTGSGTTQVRPGEYLYEPDAALMKSGAFELIAARYGLEKLDRHTQLYIGQTVNADFPGRIFQIKSLHTASLLKKQKDLSGNVLVRNYPDKAENLVKKYKIRPDRDQFLIFTQSKAAGHLIMDAEIIQHY